MSIGDGQGSVIWDGCGIQTSPKPGVSDGADARVEDKRIDRLLAEVLGDLSRFEFREDAVKAALAAAREEMLAKCEAELNKLADAALYADAADGFRAAACAIAALAPKKPRT